MSAPRVAYVLPKYDPRDDEHFAHLPHLLRELAALVDLTVVVEKGGVPPVLADRCEVVALRHGNGPRTRRVVELVGAVRSLARSDVGAVFVRYSRTFATILLLTRPLTGLRLLYWASGVPDATRPGSRRARAALAASNLHLRWIVTRADRFLTGPESMAEYFEERWGVRRERIRILYNDVDHVRFSPQAAMRRRDDDGFVVLFVHRLSPRKGSRLLVPLVEAARRAGLHDVRLVVVGDGPDLVRLRADIAAHDLTGVVDVLGSVPNHELPQLYADADCLIVPSFEEGFPRVVLEAMAMETPVVATDVGGTRDVLPSGYEHVVAAGDVAAMVRSLQVLAAAPDRGRSLGRALRSRVLDRYTTESVARMYAAVARDG